MLMIEGIGYITEKEVAYKYGLSVSWFRKARYCGKCPPYRKLNGKVFYDTHDVDEWFKANMKFAQ